MNPDVHWGPVRTRESGLTLETRRTAAGSADGDAELKAIRHALFAAAAHSGLGLRADVRNVPEVLYPDRAHTAARVKAHSARVITSMQSGMWRDAWRGRSCAATETNDGSARRPRQPLGGDASGMRRRSPTSDRDEDVP